MSDIPARRRRRMPYFERGAGDPTPLSFRVTRRVVFSDADPMGVLWHGRYPAFFEAAAAELHRSCGLGFMDFRATAVQAPVVKLEVDYLVPAFLDEELCTQAFLVWNEAARIDTEYVITKPDGRIAATGCTIQLFTCANTSALLAVAPEIWNTCRQRWRAGEFSSLQ